MAMFAGLDVGFKRTAVCVIDGAGVVVWRGVVDTHPEMIAAALQRWRRELEKVGLESGSLSPWLARELAAAIQRANWLSNRVFKSYDDIVDHCCYAWNTLIDQPWKIMFIACREWATISQSL